MTNLVLVRPKIENQIPMLNPPLGLGYIASLLRKHGHEAHIIDCSIMKESYPQIKSIIEQLKGIRCPSPSWDKGGRIFSCADAIARVIEKRLLDNSLKENTKQEKIDIEPAFITKKESEALNNIIGVCPDCGGALRHEEGCIKCQACGFTKC